MYHADVKSTVDARVIAELEPIDMEEYTRDLLDEISPAIVICGMTYSPSDVLESVDPVAFRCMVSDNYDSDTMFEASNGEYYWQSEVDDILNEEGE